ncbi:DUF1972 domain-containing protein [Flavobacterium sp. N1718]|uniref:DUF1972 domain-containing protein n=1 Tax=unclassified Flavobacterium TaxID=196869 RepID=UPI0029CAB873|nr:DUF1972 domain-containing protein [Flavobacterium sp. N1718]
MLTQDRQVGLVRLELPIFVDPESFSMKIAILGTRGIPNHYGGFEQFAEFFSVFLASRGHEVYTYCSANHPYKESHFRGVHLIHCKDPEDRIGTAGQFLYDLNCILDSRKRNFDIILQLGYTSSSVWYRLLPKKPVIITNMDGLEWKRTKFSRPVQRMLKWAEKLAVKSSDALVADSLGIQRHLQDVYGATSTYIAYGADLFTTPDEGILAEYDVVKEAYNMLIARLEPENNIEMILDGVVEAQDPTPFLVIGKHETKFGAYLKSKFGGYPQIRFIGGVYNLNHLNNLRFFSKLYFHGHSVGGTNPSLLEAMASGALIAAHQNEFNASILRANGLYFSQKADVAALLTNTKKSDNLQRIQRNSEAIVQEFNWNSINEAYEQLFFQLYHDRA